ncbi:hypothetical protein [Rhodonellum sp.]|uniref:hypothetical protein n=1 Tax=Rhodonellum sp. TaxID=2231180 RepID=UPI00271E0D0B|nr:hypothetical protein [Rhodonellum sp.]MDO9551523.1 hypothetical protein [Rhodonellum sp.]
MKRRNLLKALALTLSFPATAFGKSRSKHNLREIHVVGLGTVGSRWVADHLQGYNLSSITLISDRQPDQMPENARFFSFYPPLEVYDCFEEKRFLKTELQLDRELDLEIVDFLEGKKGMVLLIAGLGKFSGSVLCRSLAGKLCHRKNEDSLRCLVTAPFAFEGSQAGKRGQEVSDFLLSNNLDAPVLLENLRTVHGNIAVRSAFKKGDDLMMERFLDMMKSENRQ